jgi:hypothetical protein
MNEFISAYPNPFSDVLYITTLENLELKEVMMFNAIGQNVSNQVRITKTSNGIKVNTESLTKGIYIVSINGENQKVIKH